MKIKPKCKQESFVGWEGWREQVRRRKGGTELPPLQGREGARAFTGTSELTFLGLPSALPKRSECPTEEEERGERDGGRERHGMKAEQSHSVALREKESLGLDLPLPRMIFCSSFCCLWRSCSSFMRSSWIFLCSSTIRNCSSACDTRGAETARSDWPPPNAPTLQCLLFFKGSQGLLQSEWQTSNSQC